MRTAARLATLTVAVTTFAGCASPVPPHDPGTPAPTSVIGDIPQGQPYITITTKDGSATVAVPQGWQRTAGGTSLPFTSGFDSVAVDTATEFPAPTVASVTSEVLPVLQTTDESFLPGGVSTVSKPAGTAILVTYQTQSVPVSGPGPAVALARERYEFRRSGHGLVVTLSSPSGTENGFAWGKVTDSVHWLR